MRTPVWALAVALLVGCACDHEEPAPRAPALGAAEERALVVFAATSLRDAFTTMGESFEREHTGVEVTFKGIMCWRWILGQPP
jgi:molybdate transport system substrate-binding protein